MYSQIVTTNCTQNDAGSSGQVGTATRTTAAARL